MGNTWLDFAKTGGYLMHYGKTKEDGAPGRGSGRYARGSGKRSRYRNEKGELNERGKARLEYEKRRNAQRSKKNRLDDDALEDPDRWIEDDISSAKNVASNSRQLLRSTEDVIDTVWKDKQPKRLDLSKMSDEDLRKQINRELLERQYNQVFNAPQTSKGKQYVKTTLAIGGAALGVAASALEIALAVQKIKSAKGGG